MLGAPGKRYFTITAGEKEGKGTFKACKSRAYQGPDRCFSIDLTVVDDEPTVLPDHLLIDLTDPATRDWVNTGEGSSNGSKTISMPAGEDIMFRTPQNPSSGEGYVLDDSSTRGWISFGKKHYVPSKLLGGTGYDEWRMSSMTGTYSGIIKFNPSSRSQQQYGDVPQYEPITIHYAGSDDSTWSEQTMDDMIKFYEDASM